MTDIHEPSIRTWESVSGLDKWIAEHSRTTDSGVEVVTASAKALREFMKGNVLVSKAAAEFAAKVCAQDNARTESFLLNAFSGRYKDGDPCPEYLIEQRGFTREFNEALHHATIGDQP